MKVIVTIVLFILISISSMFGISVKGKITDKNGKEIPFAAISVDETNISTTSNENGDYELDLNAGEYVIAASFMNYISISDYIVVEKDPVKLDFVLIKQDYQLQNVDFSGKMEDLGVRIMRQVIKKRKEHSDLIQSLETEVYLKGNLKMIKMPDKIFGQKLEDSNKVEMGLDSAGQGIIYLLEQNTDYYYQAPNKTFNKIKSVRTSGDAQGLGFSQMPPIINIYDNNIQILSGLNERGFISPASTNALLYYDFKFEGGYEEKGRYINKIKVIPKRKYEPLFSGYVFVVDEEWLFSALELTLTRESGIDMLDTLTLQQSYKPYNNTKVWIIQNQALIPHLNLLGFGIGGNFITNYSNQKLNEKIDASIFKNKFISEYEDEALDRPASYWDSTRAIPLTNEEVRDFVKKDSMEVVWNEKDSINAGKTKYNFSTMSVIVGGMSIYSKHYRISMNPVLGMVNFNSIDGLNITLNPKFTKPLNNMQSVSAQLWTRYGFSSEKWYNKGKLEYIKRYKEMERKNLKVSLEGGRFISDITGLQPMTEIYNTFSTLYGWNYLKFYESTFAAANMSHNLANGWQYNAGIRYEDRNPLENNTTYTFNKKHQSRLTANNPSNLPVFQSHQALVVSGAVSYQPGWKYIKYPKSVSPIPSSQPTFSLQYDKGIYNVLGSDVDFDKIQLGIRHSVRMKLMGVLDYNVIGGGFLNKNRVGNPDFNHLIGNQIIFTSTHYLNAYQLAPYYRYSNTADWYWRAHAEWHLAGLISNKIPFFKRLNWHFVTGTNTLFINKNDYYAEVFAGIENIGWHIMRIGRVDFVYGYQSGLPKPSFGIRIGLNPKFFSIESE